MSIVIIWNYQHIGFTIYCNCAHGILGVQPLHFVLIGDSLQSLFPYLQCNNFNSPLALVLLCKTE